MKARFVILMFLVFAMAVPASMLAQQNSKAEKDIQSTLAQLREANLKGGAEGAAIFDKYLAEDFVRIPSDGAVYTKADTLDAFRTGKQHAESHDLSKVKIRIYGNTAVATGVLTSKSAGPLAGGNTLETRRSRFTRVFVKKGGVWQNVLYQTTKIAEPAKQ